MAIRTTSRHDPRRHAIRLLNTILGENMSSRLFQTIREDHGLAYSIYSTPSFFDDTGDLVISAGLDAENLEKTLKIVRQELERLTQERVDRQELRRAQDFNIGQTELSLESTEHQMNWVGEQWLGYGRILRPEELKKCLLAVTPEQIRRVAAEFFTPDRMTLALVSPIKSVAPFAKIFGNGRTVIASATKQA